MYRIKVRYNVEVWHDIDTDTEDDAYDIYFRSTKFNPETVVSGDDVEVSTAYHIDTMKAEVK